MPALEALHPAPLEEHSMPATPVDAPVIVVDKAKLKLLIRSYPKGLAAGPSGWTAELLLPLLEDDTCLDGIALLVQLIANNQLDPHSRRLLTSSLLLGIPKPDSDGLRPLAMGELFLKLAAKYCHDMDKGEHTDIFEPIQLALDSPSGAERAMQRVQAAIEANPTEHITLHLDCTNAFNTADRAAMLSAVFGDQRLSSSWHVFAFAYGNPSTLSHPARPRPRARRGHHLLQAGGEAGMRAGLPRLRAGDAACVRGLRLRARSVGRGHHGRLYRDRPARSSL